MKKFKALFAGAIIVIVAGASALFWYLGNDDASDTPDTSNPDSNISAVLEDDENYDTPEGAENDEPNGNGDAEQEQEPQEDGKNNEDKQESVSSTEVNEFLSVFSRVYFAENSGTYTGGNYDGYELIRFAYSHLRRTDSDCIITVQRNDSIGYYYGVPYDKVNDVLMEYLSLTISAQSIYTDNDYVFFDFDDGYFYTPAADGLGYTNLTVADSIAVDGDIIRAEFTVYSDGVNCDMTGEEAHASGSKYSSGSAEIKRTADGFTLISYNLNNGS